MSSVSIRTHLATGGYVIRGWFKAQQRQANAYSDSVNIISHIKNVRLATVSFSIHSFIHGAMDTPGGNEPTIYCGEKRFNPDDLQSRSL